MKTVKGQPITGAKRHTSHKRPFVPDAKDTSANVQTMIQEPPTPFKNKMTTAHMPTGMMAQNGPAQNPVAGKSGSKAPFHPPGGAVGQRSMPNQSGQVFGRMGTAHPKRKGGMPSVPRKGRSAFYGE